MAPLSHVPCLLEPLPKPRPDAVEAGLFGYCRDGSLMPSEEEIESIVSAHAQEMIRLKRTIHALRLRIEWEQTSKPTRKSRAELATKELHKLHLLLLGYSGAYEDAFGAVATQRLHLYIDAALGSPIETETEMVLAPQTSQLTLF